MAGSRSITTGHRTYRRRVIGSFTDLVNERRGVVEQPGHRSGGVQDDRTIPHRRAALENTWKIGAFTHRFGGEVRKLWGDYNYALDLTVFAQLSVPRLTRLGNHPSLLAGAAGLRELGVLGHADHAR